MKHLQFAIAAAVALAFSGAALTQTTGTAPASSQTDPPSALGALDANRDGSISLDEAGTNPRLTRHFMTLDQNANGALEPAEFARFETLGAASTRGTPGSPSSPGSPAPATGTPPASSTTAPAGATPPPSGSTPAPSGSTPPPSGQSTPPGG